MLLAELVAGYESLGATRVVASVPISSSSYEARLTAIADVLGVAAA